MRAPLEMYRRIGLADKIPAAGLAGDVPMDVFIITSMLERPLLRLAYPSVDAGARRHPHDERRQPAARGPIN